MKKLLSKLVGLLGLVSLYAAIGAQTYIGFPSYDATTVVEPYVVFGPQPLWEPFVNFENHPVYGRIGQAVGKLEVIIEVDGIRHPPYPCTATLIAPDLIITNYHCLPSTPRAKVINAFLRMNYHRHGSSVDLYQVDVRTLEAVEELDYAIARVEGSPGAKYGFVEWRSRRASPNESLFMIHHSSGDPKLLSYRNCVTIIRPHAIDIPILMVGRTRAFNSSTDVPHMCDSLHGSSGSLVFAYNDKAIVGLHFAGTEGERDPSRQANFFINIEAIFWQSSILRSLLPLNPDVRPEPDFVSLVDHYIIYSCGKIQDTRTNLEWYIGPNETMTLQQSREWVENLRACGETWRMPTENELATLFDSNNHAGVGFFSGGRYWPALIHPVFDAIGGGSWVWSARTPRGTLGFAYNFNQNKLVEMDVSNSFYTTRAFAVRDP